MANKKKKKSKAKRRGGRIMLFGVILCACLVVGVLFAFANVFCKVSAVSFDSTATSYTQEEIQKGCGIAVGSNLFSFQKGQVISDLELKFPLLDDITLTRVLPDKVVIGATDAVAQIALEKDGVHYVLSKSGRLMKRCTIQEVPPEALRLSGVAFKATKIGAKVTYGDIDQTKWVQDLTAKIKKSMESITALDISSKENITFYMGDQFVVNLGSDYQLDYKLQLVKEVITGQEFGVRTHLDASTPGKVISKPYVE